MPAYPLSYPARSLHREAVLAVVRFTAAATPALLEDAAKLLDQATPITDLGAGQYRLNLRAKAPYPKIDAFANLEAPTNATDRAFVQAVSEGTDPATVTVHTEVGGAIADPASKTVKVLLFLRMV